MEKNNNEEVIYLSDRAQQCLNALFTKAYKKTDDYFPALAEVAIYLLNSDEKDYDDLLKDYKGITKQMLVKMANSNFFELTYYRNKNGVKLDNFRQTNLDFIEGEVNGIAKCIIGDAYQFVEILNDVLFYFWHVSPIYSYNATKAIRESGIHKTLYADVYDLAVLEHALTIQNMELTDKEFLYYTLIECMSNAVERQVFAAGKYPIPVGYRELMYDTLKKYNGRDKDLPNLHTEVIEEFTNKTGLENGPDYDKILIVEMLSQILNLKRQIIAPTKDERDLYIGIEIVDKNIESISEFYDKNKEKIIESLISNWMFYPDDIVLSDRNMFEPAKTTGQQYVKRRFDKKIEEK